MSPPGRSWTRGAQMFVGSSRNVREAVRARPKLISACLTTAHNARRLAERQKRLFVLLLRCAISLKDHFSQFQLLSRLTRGAVPVNQMNFRSSNLRPENNIRSLSEHAGRARTRCWINCCCDCLQRDKLLEACCVNVANITRMRSR